MPSFFGRPCHSPIPRCAAVTLVALACSSVAFGGEIHEAVRGGDLEKVKALLKDNSGLVDSKDDSRCATPLNLAASLGYKDVAELLLANKAKVNATNINGWTPLHYAARQGHKQVAELLLANKAEVNAVSVIGYTPLHLAAYEGHKDVAELLLANKAKDNAKDEQGVTPLRMATAEGHKDVAELLVQHGGHE